MDRVCFGPAGVACAVIAVVGGSAAAFGQVGIKTDYGVYAPRATAPVLPAAGGTFTDPVFGSKVLRVTDAADGNNNITSYAYWPTFNNNSSFIRYYANGTPKLATFDPVTMTLSGKRDLFLSRAPSGNRPVWDDVIWDAHDPNVIYGHDKLNVWAYNVVSDRYTLVHNFADEYPAAGHIQQMSRSEDNNVFAFTLQDKDYGRIGAVAWQRDTNQVRMHRTDISNINEVRVDKTGRYVLVSTEAQGAGVIQARVVDLQTSAVANLTDNGPDFAPGHGDLGRGTVVAAENWDNRILARNLETPHQWTSVFKFPDWSQSMHLSMLADNEQWALVSTFTAGTGQPSTGKFQDEIFMVATDGTGDVIRLAHHYSTYNSYYDSPRADISPDGRFVAFTSNWGNSGRRDVFIVATPEPGSAMLVTLAAGWAMLRRRAIGRE